MAVEPTSRAKLVSARELTRMVDEAVKAAGQAGGGGTASGGGGATFSGGLGGGHTVILRPDIVGRLLRDAAQAQHFADAVSKSVGKAGVHVDPVVVPLGAGGHLAGFIERDVAQLREL